MLSTLLLRQFPAASKRGRVIKFDEGTPDICYTTGSMRDRVLQFLKDTQTFATASEVAKGIACSPSRTTRTLSTLVEEGLIETIKLDGCVREYQWAAAAAEKTRPPA